MASSSTSRASVGLEGLVFIDEVGAKRVEGGGVFAGDDEFLGGEAVFQSVESGDLTSRL